jgi:hypothetical protein
MSKPPKISDPSEITHVRCLAAMTDREKSDERLTGLRRILSPI